MPIFSWYLLKNYLKVLLLSLISFIAILLVSRLEEIAQFAVMGAKPTYLALFSLYQIPYILPIAIPISCLISAMIVFQRLSQTHELTALRSCGIALQRIMTPILVAGAFLSIGTFYITSEMATSSHLATRKMVHDLCSVNPLLLLQSAKIARLQDAFVQMEPIRNGESAKDLVIALNNGAGERLNLCLVKQIEMEEEKLLAHQVSLISSSPTGKSFDHLIIENQQLMSSSAPEFAKLLRKSGWKVANDHLKFSLLRIRTQMLQQNLSHDKHLLRSIKKCHSEIVRRISSGIATFTFTLMGASFGMEIGRNQKKRGIFAVLLLSVICLIAFCVGKTFDSFFWIASLLFLLPHALITLASIWTVKRINQGIE
jgi:lipopolysaccharide export system permease protein